MGQRHHVLHVEVAILWAQVIQCAVIHQEIESAADVVQVGEVVHDERHRHSGGLCSCPCLINRRRGEIHAGDVEALLRQEDSVASCPAAKINGPAGSDASALHQPHQFLARARLPRHAKEPVAQFVEQLHGPLLSCSRLSRKRRLPRHTSGPNCSPFSV